MKPWFFAAALAACAPPAADTDAPPDDPDPDTSVDEPDPQPDPSCAEPGCLREVARLGAWDRTALAALLPPELDIDNGYEVWIVTYWTDADREATATVTLPIDPTGPAPAAGWPIVVNAHGTVGIEDPCRLSGTVSGSALAGLFGARGTIGVAPDYPGLGTPGLHPYLDARSEGTSVLDAIRAAARLARVQAVPHDGRSAIVGMSQGGHAAIAAASIRAGYAPELDVRAIGAAAPASGFAEHWRSGATVAGAHVPLHALLVYTFADAAPLDPRAVWAGGVAPSEHLRSRCGWDPDFLGRPTLYDDFPQTFEAVFTPAFLADYRAGTLARWPAVADGFRRARLAPWTVAADGEPPIVIWQGTEDAVVLPWMTEDLVAALRDGGVPVELRSVPGAGHVDTAFGFLAVPERATDDSVGWVLERLRAP